MLDAKTAENTSRSRMHIKNSLRRDVKLPVNITAIMIEHLETKISAVTCTGSTCTDGSYTVVKIRIK